MINFFAKVNMCYEECPAVSVPTPSKVCLACTNNCLTCDELPDRCVTCDKGFFLHKQQCVRLCPFGYFQDDDAHTCESAGSLELPIPFTILAVVLSFGIALSSCLKGTDHHGRAQPGTAFFLTTLAVVDCMLRINWILMIILCWNAEYKVTSAFFFVIIIVSGYMNIMMWRRFFYSKYRYEEDDPLFCAYCDKYPTTSRFILGLSYLLSFQAVRLTYSRLLGKKQFMARFTRRRRYYRLIGRLSVLKIFILYIPAIATNIYNLFYIKQGEQIFYIDIDSLILVGYAMILIIVVLNQREKLLDPTHLFRWGDLFKIGELEEDPMDIDSSAYGDSRGFNKGQTDAEESEDEQSK
jgi:hypothetical protein